MIITCEQCQTRFKVAPEQIKEGGSKVRCSSCQHVFTVFRPEERKEPPEPAISAESARARRERRRSLYSDLEDEPGRAAFDDSLDDLFGDDDDGGQPPLRRLRRDHLSDEGEEPDPFENPDDELPPPLSDRDDKDVLGLGSDPRGSKEKEAQGASIRGAERASSGKNSKILLILAISATFLLAGLYYMSNRPEPRALSGAESAPEDGGAAPGPAAAAQDSVGTLGITFSKNNQNHYFRENTREGSILIITGMVKNSYQERRSFIQLRGRLISADGSTLADRYAYAGNLVSEEELISLPIAEIISRLSIKGGQNGQNMNVDPGREVPFMLVFDKLPDGMTEYRIDPMGSVPSQE